MNHDGRLTEADARRLIHRRHELISSPRQREILIHIAFDRLSFRKTAELMNLSTSTIHGHWTNLCRLMVQARDEEENPDA